MTSKAPRNKWKRNLSLLLFAGLMLSSCGPGTLGFKAATTAISASMNGFFTRTDVNLKEKNYAAADFLSQRMKNTISPNALILARMLEEDDNAGISSPLGAHIAEGVGLRLIELGYNVNLHDTLERQKTNPYPPPPAGYGADYVLKGTYRRQADHIHVNLIIAEIKSGKIISHFDYPLSLSREVRDLSQTPPRIYKIPAKDSL